MAVIEAMATGCPVVLSDIPPHREVADGVDFVPFVRTGDVGRASPARSRRFRSMSPADGRAIGLKGRKTRARARFGLPTMHAALREGLPASSCDRRAHRLRRRREDDARPAALRARGRRVLAPSSMPDLVLDRRGAPAESRIRRRVNVVQEVGGLPVLPRRSAAGPRLPCFRSTHARALCAVDLRPAQRACAASCGRVGMYEPRRRPGAEQRIVLSDEGTVLQRRTPVRAHGRRARSSR